MWCNILNLKTFFRHMYSSAVCWLDALEQKWYGKSVATKFGVKYIFSIYHVHKLSLTASCYFTSHSHLIPLTLRKTLTNVLKINATFLVGWGFNRFKRISQELCFSIILHCRSLEVNLCKTKLHQRQACFLFESS